MTVSPVPGPAGDSLASAAAGLSLMSPPSLDDVPSFAQYVLDLVVRQLVAHRAVETLAVASRFRLMRVRNMAIAPYKEGLTVNYMQGPISLSP